MRLELYFFAVLLLLVPEGAFSAISGSFTSYAGNFSSSAGVQQYTFSSAKTSAGTGSVVMQLENGTVQFLPVAGGDSYSGRPGTTFTANASSSTATLTDTSSTNATATCSRSGRTINYSLSSDLVSKPLVAIYCCSSVSCDPRSAPGLQALKFTPASSTGTLNISGCAGAPINGVAIDLDQADTAVKFAGPSQVGCT